MGRVIEPDRGRTRLLRGRGRSELERLCDAVDRLSAALQLEQTRRSEATEHLARAAVALAVPMAKHLVGDQLERKADSILDLLTPLLTPLRAAAALHIVAHPDDAALLREVLAKGGPEEPTLEVHVDADLGRGSLQVHSDVGSLDGRLEVRLGHLARGLSSVAGDNLDP